MAKERKTKRQKLASDRRLKQQAVTIDTESLYSLDLSSKEKGPKSVSSSESKVSKQDYKYLATDMRKTAIITSLIVMFELGVYFISVSS